MIEIEGVKFDVPDAVSELLRVVSVERDELKTENGRLRIACTAYRANSTAWEEKYTNATPVSDRVYKLVAHQSSPDDLKIVDEVKAVEQENFALKQAIQNTLNTGMDRYIREVEKAMDDSNSRCIAEHWNEMND